MQLVFVRASVRGGAVAGVAGYRRLQVRYERRADILTGFVYLACALICLRQLRRSKL